MYKIRENLQAILENSKPVAVCEPVIDDLDCIGFGLLFDKDAKVIVHMKFHVSEFII